MSNCCENTNEFVRRRRKLVCNIFLGLIVSVLAIGIIKYLSYKVARPSSKDRFEYFVLSVSWPISFCRSLIKNGKSHAHKCNLSEDHWTIHGLWPSFIGYYPPVNCTWSPFNETELEPIRNQLEEYWPTKKNCWNNLAFWKHEWLKHGICALELKSVNNQLKYFQRTLELYKEYNVTEALEDCKIRPNNSTSYQKNELVDCFLDHFTVSPQLSCNKLLNETLLTEVQFCFDRRFTVKNCGHSFFRKDTCNDTFQYPAHI